MVQIIVEAIPLRLGDIYVIYLIQVDRNCTKQFKVASSLVWLCRLLQICMQTCTYTTAHHDVINECLINLI